MDFSDNNMIVRVDKEIDHFTADRIRREFDEYYLRGRVKNVIFDMSQVEFMDSSGIGMVMGRYTKLKPVGGKVMVAAVPGHIDKLFAMAGVYEFVCKCDNVIQAINLVNKKVRRYDV